MVTVRVSETYDLSTKVNKMGIVGIHTPTGSLIDKMWPGLVLQHKKMRFVKCDVAMACASMLPADPLQVGVEAGAIAPQDMFNPILYKAVSNDSMSNILAYLMGAGGEPALDFPNVDKGSIVDINNTLFTSSPGATGELSPTYDQFKMYYGLLADSNGWKKAMPQAGLTMRGLYPLVYQVIHPYGINNRGTVPSENDRQVDVWYDPIGNRGKSWLAGHLFETGQACVVPRDWTNPSEITNYLVHNYQDEGIIVIDIPRETGIPKGFYATVEMIKDGLIGTTKWEGKMRNIRGVKIMIMTNHMLDLKKLSKDRWRLNGINAQNALNGAPRRADAPRDQHGQEGVGGPLS